MIELVRDVLDKKLLDNNACLIGRVDGIVMEFPVGRQPRMVRVEIGGEILAARVAHWLVRPVRWLRRSFGPKREAAVRIEWKHVTRMGRDIHLDIPGSDTHALAWEHWMARLIGRIPGAE